MAGRIVTNGNRLAIVVVHPTPIEFMRGRVTTAAMNVKMWSTKLLRARPLGVCFGVNSVSAVAIAPTQSCQRLQISQG
jgi:hypothetical protein